jgi:hypothetical protein
MKINNLITSGCSFSSGGIGGVPPNDLTNGGCSFIDGGNNPIKAPISWPGFLAQQLKVTSLVNTATPGQGNILIANTLLELIKRYNYKITNTLIVFNLTDPWRLDIPCDWGDSKIQHRIPWDKNLISYAYIDQSSQYVEKMKSEMGIDVVEQYTSNTVEFLFNLLEYQQWNYCFLMMNDYLNHKYLGSIIEKFQHKLILLDPGSSMIEFCEKTNNCVSKFDNHPSLSGHKAIANILYEYVSD